MITCSHEKKRIEAMTMELASPGNVQAMPLKLSSPCGGCVPPRSRS